MVGSRSLFCRRNMKKRSASTPSTSSAGEEPCSRDASFIRNSRTRDSIGRVGSMTGKLRGCMGLSRLDQVGSDSQCRTGLVSLPWTISA